MANERQTAVRKLAGEIAKMTDEQRQEIANKLGTVINPDGHALTLNNTILLWMQSQRTDLTVIAGFKQWIKAGRVVRKGEHSIGCIMVPIRGKKEEENGEEKRPLYFKMVSVFDVSQTDELQSAAA